jgi:hypothetical protein
MNENEAQRIAAAVHSLRPDWPLASLLTLLQRPQLAKSARRDVAVALTWVACESETQTPARVLESGPWWTAVGAEGVPFTRDNWLDRCSTCNRTESACRGAADHEDDGGFVSIGDVRSRRARAQARVDEEAMAACRANVAAARALATAAPTEESS